MCSVLKDLSLECLEVQAKRVTAISHMRVPKELLIGATAPFGGKSIIYD